MEPQVLENQKTEWISSEVSLWYPHAKIITASSYCMHYQRGHDGWKTFVLCSTNIVLKVLTEAGLGQWP